MTGVSGFVSFYLLFIQIEQEVTAYIGATSDPFRRMSEHLINTQEPIISRYSSSDLVKVAKKRKAPICVLFLEAGFFDRQERIRVEGAWIAAAKRAGFRLPGVERWGNIGPGQERRSMGLAQMGLGCAPQLQDLFRRENEGAGQSTAFQRAMAFAAK